MISQRTEGEGRSARAGATRVGESTYSPASTGWAGRESGILHHEGRDIDLCYSSSVFEDFLEAMTAIEYDFTRRFLGGTTSVKPSVDERPGQNSRV
ncbi:hypothetical protein [Streptomyces sp. NBC_00211]|uniref:hypothetical protein n=1 Tax=Streptomyces sp. NBC_00211 TaxID=2975683 RepID=UPI003245A499